MKNSVFDVAKKFVKVVELRRDGFVEFEFAIGEPELFVEMVLPSAAFDDFCACNRVTFLDDGARLKLGDKGDDDWRWSLRDATQQRFRSTHE